MAQTERLLAYGEALKRLNVSVNEDLHRELKMAVAAQGVTIGQFVTEAIKEKIEKDRVSGK